VLEQPLQLATVKYLLDQRIQYLKNKNEKLVNIIDELNAENNEIINPGDYFKKALENVEVRIHQLASNALTRDMESRASFVLYINTNINILMNMIDRLDHQLAEVNVVGFQALLEYLTNIYNDADTATNQVRLIRILMEEAFG